MSGVQPFAILSRESLLSPHDPGFLDGAPPLARFGLDIGGTLCKVVYFEPAANSTKKESEAGGVTNGQVLKDNCASVAKPDEIGGKTVVNGDGWSADSLKKSSGKERNGCVGNGIDRNACNLRLKDDNAKDLTSLGVDQLTITNTETTGVTLSHNEENGKDKSGGAPAVQVFDHDKDDRSREGTGCNEDDQDSHKRVKKIWVSSHEPVHLPGRGTLYFKCFETWRMEEFLNLTKEYHLMTGGRAIGATGGGARKFGDQFLEIAGLQLQKADELKSLVRGIDFLARHAQQDTFEYPTGSCEGGSIQRPWNSPEISSEDCSDISSEEDFWLVPCREESEPKKVDTVEVPVSERQRDTQKTRAPRLKGPVLAELDSGVWMGSNDPRYPYLVVNIGSGVSILRVDSPEKFERVGGTSLGGSTFLGLTKALTGCQSFEEAIFLATQGDSTHVDMLVGDIYGGDYTEMGLAATTVASSFGKLVREQKTAESQDPQHLAKAALIMVTNNIGSIACLHAKHAGLSSILFTGSLLHNNKVAMRLLSVGMEFWSKGNMKAVFLRHEGHAGAMGALLSALEPSDPLDSLLLT